MKASSLFLTLSLSGFFVASIVIWSDWQKYWQEEIGQQSSVHIPATLPDDFYKRPVIQQIFPKDFYLQAKLIASGDRLQAGQYSFMKNESRQQLYRKIVSQKTDYSKFRIREGWCWKQLWQALDKAPGLKKDLKSGEQRSSLAEKFGAVSLEGIFAPDTYFYTSGMSQSDLLTLGFKQQQKILSKISCKSPFLPDHNAVLTLASIIQKEGSDLESFKMVSGVFHNRLAKKMRLQSDATVLYLMDGPVRRLSRQDLWTEGAHNTYRHNGLPPFAIAYPSKNAIIAAVDPIPSDYLYFLTDKDGCFLFSKEFKEHAGNKKYM